VLVDVIEHVFASDSTARTRSGDAIDVETVLGYEATHDR